MTNVIRLSIKSSHYELIISAKVSRSQNSLQVLKPQFNEKNLKLDCNGDLNNEQMNELKPSRISVNTTSPADKIRSLNSKLQIKDVSQLIEKFSEPGSSD